MYNHINLNIKILLLLLLNTSVFKKTHCKTVTGEHLQWRNHFFPDYFTLENKFLSIFTFSTDPIYIFS